MHRISKERRAFLLFLIFFTLSVLMITIDYHGKGVFGFARDMGMTVFKPIAYSTQHLVDWLSSRLQLLYEARKIQEENISLSEQNQWLYQENALLREKLSSYERLEKMVQFRESYLYDMIDAQVIGREPDNWFHSVIIDRGTKDQVDIDMGVANHIGLIGKIIQTEQNASQVLLLLDQSCSVGAMIQRSREIGVIKGSTDGLYCFLEYIAHDADVQVHDMVVTSGMGSSIPKGIQIGRVVAIKKEKHDLFQRILIKPEVDFNKLEEVFVVKQMEYD